MVTPGTIDKYIEELRRELAELEEYLAINIKALDQARDDAREAEETRRRWKGQ